MASYGIVFQLMSVLFLVVMSFFWLPGKAARLHYDMASNAEDLVSMTCNHTLYFEVCVSSLRSDPQSQTSDLKGLADIALNLSMAQAMETLSFTTSLNRTIDAGNDTESNQYLSRCLSDCIDEYSEALENLQQSTQALRDRAFEDVNTLVTTAMTDSETCEDGFEEVPNGHSPLTNRTQYFNMLCSNFLAITTLLT